MIFDGVDGEGLDVDKLNVKHAEVKKCGEKIDR